MIFEITVIIVIITIRKAAAFVTNYLLNDLADDANELFSLKFAESRVRESAKLCIKPDRLLQYDE